MNDGKKKKKKRKFTSVTSIFSKALKKLMKTLAATEPYFVRCVNPNKQKSKEVFVRQVVEDQLRSGGILEALRVLKLGYPTRVEYNVLYARYQGKIDNPLVNNLPPNKFAAAVLIAFGVNREEYELGLTKIFFKPAKAQILEEIMNQEEPLTEEQNQRILDWLAQGRIKQLMGALKVYNYYGVQVKDMRAKVRWQKSSVVMGALGTSLVRFLKHARLQLNARKNKEAATTIQQYFRAYTERMSVQKKLKKRRLACKKVWKAYTAYVKREAFMKVLVENVEKTRKDEAERKRREEEAKKAMAAAAAEEERKEIARKAAVNDLKAFCERQLKDQMKDIVQSADSEAAAIEKLKSTFAEVSERKAKNDYSEQLGGAVPDEIGTEVLGALEPAIKKAYADYQEKLKKEAEEAARKKAEREAAEKQKEKNLEVAKKQAARATAMANEARATKMAAARAEKPRRSRRRRTWRSRRSKQREQ